LPANEHEAEAYVVHLMARNFERTDIGEQTIAIRLLENFHQRNKKEYALIGDECLLIQSFPLKRRRWPSEDYYVSMGQMAYYMADNETMKESFIDASRVLSGIFKQLNT
jgi:hypothetical protein